MCHVLPVLLNNGYHNHCSLNPIPPIRLWRYCSCTATLSATWCAACFGHHPTDPRLWNAANVASTLEPVAELVDTRSTSNFENVLASSQITYPWGLRLIPGIERHEMNLAEDVAMVWETHLIVFNHGAVPMVFRLALPKTAPSCQEIPME